jgi:hypothetical protein
MANEVITTLDPLGRTIFLLSGISITRNEEYGIFDDAATVIKKPAILLEVKENSETEFYYFRSIGWNNTLLIKVHFKNNRWEAYHCTKNPSNEELTAILRKGKQIL